MLLLAGTIQASAPAYMNTYKGTVYHQPSVISYQTAAPTVGFQSTSAYSEQWENEQAQSMLNSDGSVNPGAYLSSGPSRAKKDGPGGGAVGPGSPGGPLDPTTQQPLGEGIFALLLMAMAYVGARTLRARAAWAARRIYNKES